MAPEDPEYVYWTRQMLQEARQAHSHTDRGREGHAPKWHKLHKAAFARQNLHWPAGQPRPYNEFVKLLPLRCRECLVYDEHLHPRWSFTRRFLQLGQSLGRQGATSSGTPCIIPNGCMWERTRQGPVLGVELLAAQGMAASMRPASREFSNGMLVDLAGDALLMSPARRREAFSNVMYLGSAGLCCDSARGMPLCLLLPSNPCDR